MLCSRRSSMVVCPFKPRLLFWMTRVKKMSGQPKPVRRRFAPVKLAMTLGSQCAGSLPAFQAIVPSTKYSGIVCTIATTARASPRLIEDSAASEAHAINSEAAITAPKVETATAKTRLGARNTTRTDPMIHEKRATYSMTSLLLTLEPLPQLVRKKSTDLTGLLRI